MKIVFISHACVSQAHQEKLEELARHSDIELFLIVPHWWEEGTSRFRLIKRDNLNFTLIPLPTLFTGRQFIHFYLNLALYLKRIDPDIIHLEEEPNSAVSFQTLWLRNKLKLKTRVIQFSWQNMFQSWRFPDPRCWFYPFFERYSLRNADYIIAGNKEGKEIFLKKGYAGGIKVIPQFGINPDEFKKIDTSYLKQKLGLNKFVIGYLGRLLKMKGLYTLLEAVSKIRNDYQLLIIGDGPEKVCLKATAERLGIKGRTILVESIDHRQVPRYLNCMDVLVLPSEHTPNWKEQFGRVLVEAMGCEVPVIGSTCGEIPNVMGEAGLVFEEGNDQDLRAKLEMIINSDSLTAELAEKGRQRVLDNYTTEKIVKETYRTYRDLSSRRGK